MTTDPASTGWAIAAAIVLGFTAAAARAEPPEPLENADAAADCPCADGAEQPGGHPAESHPEPSAPFEPSYIVSLAAIPRVDGWDDFANHRSGWGMTTGVDLSPWGRHTELHLELIYLTNRKDRLVSVDFGLKVPFHQGHRWDVHGVVGPSLAYDRESRTLENGEREVEHGFVVGMITGLGTAYWFHPHLGATLDVNYRVLGGEGIVHRIFTSIGMAARW